MLHVKFRTSILLAAFVVLAGTAAPSALAVDGTQTDIVGPAGSVSFGTAFAVLPNGNIVVTDPDGPVSGVGAVYLYAPDGSPINWFTGSSENDHVGSGGIVVLTNGNFVVLSPQWHNEDAADAGAVTWVDGSAGMTGLVTDDNSLVGSTAEDAVGTSGSVTALSNGNYVVTTPAWSNGSATSAGAATFGDGTMGIAGAISADNSLIGTQTGDNVGNGGAAALPDGDYVVVSSAWANGSATQAGAVTLADGTVGLSGTISSDNSLVGSTNADAVGSDGITVLPNGDFVIVSSSWNNGAASAAGAATFADAVSGITGTIASSNSLVGTHAQDHVGRGGIEVLSNGNYVVDSPDCANVSVSQAGAVTWASGSTGLSGIVEPANSLVGTATGDQVGGGVLVDFPLVHHVAALTNGNYVVISASWSNGSTMNVGAVTWVDGTKPQPGVVSAANSLIGSTQGDNVGARGVFVLPDGDYVVDSLFWNDGATTQVGAVTLLSGTHKTSANVSSSNSLVGTTDQDSVGNGGVAVLTNGNFVVGSESWHNGGARVGAATWVNGSAGLTGPVTTSNSLVGTNDGDGVGEAFALSNGNYIVESPQWTNGTATGAGAVTWGDGSVGTTGVVSPANSLVGTQTSDSVSLGLAPITTPYGLYVINSRQWNNGALTEAGAITLGIGDGSTVGPITSADSVIGDVASGGLLMTYAYDEPRARLVVGQPASNLVSIFTYGVPNDVIFANGFED